MISVIVPVYNVDKYIHRCVQSIIKQTFTDLEVILVDDGSTDDSGEICDELATIDSRITVIHKVNGGISSARNAGLAVASGDYIGFVDSDDEIAPTMYERLLTATKESKSQIACCGYKALDEDGNPCKQIYSDVPAGIMTVDEYVSTINKNSRTHAELVVVWNKLYSRKVMEDVTFREGIIHEDEFFLNHTVLNTDKISIIADQLYYYYQHPKSVIHVDFDSRRINYFFAVKERVECCEKLNLKRDTINCVRKECIDVGIRFWLLADYKVLLSEQDKEIFYQEIIRVMDEYDAKVSFKRRALWFAFKKAHKKLSYFYNIYKRIVG